MAGLSASISTKSACTALFSYGGVDYVTNTYMARNDRAALNAPRAKPIRCGYNLPLIPANAPPFSPTRSILFNALPRSASSYCFVTLMRLARLSGASIALGYFPIDMVALTDSKDRPQNRRHGRSTLPTPSGLGYTGSGGRTARCPSWSTDQSEGCAAQLLMSCC